MTQDVLLLVDDEDDNLAIFSAILTHNGYSVVLATNGREAVEMAREHTPKLVLMDLNMPLMDGWEATRVLRSRPETSHIPVIAVTAEPHITAPRLQKAGFCAYVAKPVLPQHLYQAVEFCLRRVADGDPWIELPDLGAAPLVAKR